MRTRSRLSELERGGREQRRHAQARDRGEGGPAAGELADAARLALEPLRELVGHLVAQRIGDDDDDRTRAAPEQRLDLLGKEAPELGGTVDVPQASEVALDGARPRAAEPLEKPALVEALGRGGQGADRLVERRDQLAAQVVSGRDRRPADAAGEVADELSVPGVHLEELARIAPPQLGGGSARKRARMRAPVELHAEAVRKNPPLVQPHRLSSTSRAVGTAAAAPSRQIVYVHVEVLEIGTPSRGGARARRKRSSRPAACSARHRWAERAARMEGIAGTLRI